MQKEIDEYLDWKSQDTTRAPVTYRKALLLFSQFVQKEAVDVREHDVRRYVSVVKSKWNGGTIKYNLVIIKNFFKYLWARNYPVLNPWLIRIPKYTPKELPELSLADFKRIDRTLSVYTYQECRRKAILHIFAYTGIRVSELCNLQMSHVDMPNRRLEIKNAKNIYSRTLKWPKSSTPVLASYIAARLVLDSSPYLFVNESTNKQNFKKPLTTRSVERFIKEMKERAKIHKNITPHSARRGKAQRMSDKGADLKYIMDHLGHTNPMSTIPYLKRRNKVFEKSQDRFM